MLRLLLLRHAKSSWDEPGLADFDRPLAPRGVKAAPAMGRRLAETGYIPTNVFCSTARRARQTLALALPHISPAPAVSYTDDLYRLRDDDYLDFLSSEGGQAPVILLVGHNPAMQQTALELAGQGDRGVLDSMAAKFPTAAIAAIDFDRPDWSLLTAGSGRLTDFLRPPRH